MRLSNEFKRRLVFAKKEMQDAGLGEGGLLYDRLQKLGIPVPPLAYGSFLLNSAVIAFYAALTLGAFFVIYALIVAKSFDVIRAVLALNQTPEFWIIVSFTGLFAGVLSVYRRWKYGLTKWNAI